jgi:myo-inositol 2-dehydrogenase/D-chiro-inositol 1-dehydrogenase
MGAYQAHLLSGMPHVDVIVCDIDENAAKLAADACGGSPVTSLNELLAEQPEGVLVCTPTGRHREVVEQLIDRRMPVLCEKPLALHIDDAEYLARLADERGVLLQVGLQRRFDSGYLDARRAARSGVLGDLEHVLLLSFDPEPPSEQFRRSSGGLLLDEHIHDFDIARWLTDDEVVEVMAVSVPQGVEPDLVERVVATLTTSRGVLVTVIGGMRNGGGCDVRAEVHGTRDTVVVGGTAASVAAAGTGAAPPADFRERFEQAYRDQLARFVDSLDGAAEPLRNARDAVAAARIAEAAKASLRRCAPVRIDELQPGGWSER